MKKLKLITSFLISLLTLVGAYQSYGTPESAIWVLAFTGWLTVLFNEIDKT